MTRGWTDNPMPHSMADPLLPSFSGKAPFAPVLRDFVIFTFTQYSVLHPVLSWTSGLSPQIPSLPLLTPLVMALNIVYCYMSMIF